MVYFDWQHSGPSNHTGNTPGVRSGGSTKAVYTVF